MNLQIGSKDVKIVDNISTTKQVELVPEIKRNFKAERNAFKSPLIESSDNNENSEKSISSSTFNETKKRPEIVDNENHSIKRFKCPSSIESSNKFTNTNKIKFEIPLCILHRLKEYQKVGVEFMFNCVMGEKTSGFFGCILADEMGLGKTIQTIALMLTLKKLNVIKRIIIVTPSSLVANWNREIEKWLKDQRMYTFIADGKKTIKEFCNSLHIPIMLVSYEMFLRKKDEFRRINFDLMVLDEGHRLKNENSKIYKALMEIDCKRRVLLTGTPFQNDLYEFFAVVNMVNPGILGSYDDFKFEYEQPIRAGVMQDSSEELSSIATEKSMELQEKSSKFIIKRDQIEIGHELPQKQEMIVVIRPSILQQKMIEALLEFYCNRNETETDNFTSLEIITVMKKICNHPHLISKENEKENFLLNEVFNEFPQQQFFNFSIPKSGKLKVLSSLLDDIKMKNERVVIASYYTKTLDMLQQTLFKKQMSFVRLDGSTKTQDRMKIVNQFNDKDSETFCFLLSSKSGGVGLNLIGASRLILYDCDWNPANDAQVCARIFRQGQTKNVFIYRFITCGTIEEKILQRQISKNTLGEAIFDIDSISNNPGNMFNDSEIKELFNINSNIFIECQTHEIIGCKCQCFGEFPDITIENEDISGCEGEEENTKHELMTYQHYKSPYDEDSMEIIGLKDDMDEIVFLFHKISGQFE